MDAENIYTSPEAMPANAAMVRGMPGLMAFYNCLRDKVFPDGPSDRWLEGMFDPKKRLQGAAPTPGRCPSPATDAPADT